MWSTPSLVQMYCIDALYICHHISAMYIRHHETYIIYNWMFIQQILFWNRDNIILMFCYCVQKTHIRVAYGNCFSQNQNIANLFKK